MLRDDDTRPLRPAGKLRRISGPEYAMQEVAKSLWINDSGVVTVNMIAECDTDPERVNICGPGLIPVRVRAIISEGTTARDILALHD
jgi:hypothetical protein